MRLCPIIRIQLLRSNSGCFFCCHGARSHVQLYAKLYAKLYDRPHVCPRIWPRIWPHFWPNVWPLNRAQ